MSQPSDVLLAWGRYENLDEEMNELEGKPFIQSINDWLTTHSNSRDPESELFHPLPDDFSNGFVAGANIYAGSFNFFDPGELLGFLRTLGWQAPEDVQLFVRDFEATTFELFTLADYRRAKPREASAGDAYFAGQLVAFDGTLTLLSREHWGEIIELGGGHVTYKVSDRTTLVIGGKNCDQELAKAYRLGIATIWEHELHAKLPGNKTE